MLPKFLLATNVQERLGYIYIVHNQTPKFVIEGSEEDFDNDYKVYWIDEPNIDKAEQETLIAEAIYFLDEELALEDNFDDDEDC